MNVNSLPAQGINQGRSVVSSITLHPETGVYLVACADPANPVRFLHKLSYK